MLEKLVGSSRPGPYHP